MAKLYDYTQDLKSEPTEIQKLRSQLRELIAEIQSVDQKLAGLEPEISRAQAMALRQRMGVPKRTGAPYEADSFQMWEGVLGPDKKAAPPYGEAGALPGQPRGVDRDPKGTPTGKLETLLRKFGKLSKRE